MKTHKIKYNTKQKYTMPEKRGKLNMIWNEGVKELVGQKELSFEENERQVKD